MINLYIFHYHLLPGGVTSVIVEGIKALLYTTLNNGSSPIEPLPIKKITLVTGRKNNTENVYNSIQNFFPENWHEEIRERISIEILPDIDYQDPDNINVKDAGMLAKKLLEHYGGNDSIWWIHNYHLGKNPIFTEALLEIAEKDTGVTPKMLFQIHDFPESGRYENLKFLKTTLKHQPYPVGPKIRYIVINPRDRSILTRSGIPDKLVYLLENPSNIERISTPNQTQREQWREKILDFYNQNTGNRRTHTSSKNTKLILYPIRAIRRKNVFEAALIALIANRQRLDKEYKLIVTLPGVSKPERQYSSQVEEAFNNGIIEGFFKTGMDLEAIGVSFEELVHASDIILSSSVQEGFGFSFIQAIIWGKPLFARKIDVLESFGDLFNGYPHHFYSNFLCPLPQSIRKSITEAYKIKVEAISTVLPPHSIERLKREVEELTSRETLDFSFLDVDTQISILEKVSKEESLQREILKLNLEKIQNFNSLLEEKPSEVVHQKKLKNIGERFGFSHYSSKFIEIISSFNNNKLYSDTDKNPSIWDNIIDNFAKIDYLRLIYE